MLRGLRVDVLGGAENRDSADLLAALIDDMDHVWLCGPLGMIEQYALVNVEADRMTNSLNTLREQVERWAKRKLAQRK